MWKNTLIFTLFIYKIVHSLSHYNTMYKYAHNNKYQMKYIVNFVTHSEARKLLKDNIYAERSKAENFFEK